MCSMWVDASIIVAPCGLSIDGAAYTLQLLTQIAHA